MPSITSAVPLSDSCVPDVLPVNTRSPVPAWVGPLEVSCDSSGGGFSSGGGDSTAAGADGVYRYLQGLCVRAPVRIGDRCRNIIDTRRRVGVLAAQRSDQGRGAAAGVNDRGRAGVGRRAVAQSME